MIDSEKMPVDEVGLWRFCPACARPILPPILLSEEQYSDAFDYESPRCSGCERPWIACCCKPVNK